jgi:phosphoribosylformylglycinamidine cyclo-ligase
MTNDNREQLTYTDAGVKPTNVASGMEGLLQLVRKTFDIRPTALDLGYYASVIDVGSGLGVAVSTDGVGTKILVAQLCNRYDTVGIDCVAMNANDVICVGARPLSMVDYIAVQQADEALLGQLAQGLYKGAEIARINIPGGEVAQVKEMLTGVRPGYAFDLVGTCIGTVPIDQMIVGQNVRPGDVIIGIASSGLHSNGFTLARQVLFDKMKLTVDSQLPEFGRSVGEELLEPTAIYVDEAMSMIEAGLDVKSLTHITSDGLLNLARAKAEVGYKLTRLPPIPPVFSTIAQGGPVSPAEMWRVFNMGIGFCAIVDPNDADRALALAGKNRPAMIIGEAIADRDKRVYLEPVGLVGTIKNGFAPG